MVYLVAEILPELIGNGRARQAVSGVTSFLDPGRELRDAMRQKEIAPTVQNKRQLKTGEHNLIAMGVSQRPGTTLFFGGAAAAVLERSEVSILFVAG
jgi:hypothetical protein